VTLIATAPVSITVPDSRAVLMSVPVAIRRVNRMPAGPSPPARVHVRDAGNRNRAVRRERLDRPSRYDACAGSNGGTP
jgi:hypothetical protein